MICPECCNYGRATGRLLTEHHPKCSQYNLELEALKIITALVRGMEYWASDEDGVHYKAWDAYEKAKMMIGEKPTAFNP